MKLKITRAPGASQTVRWVDMKANMLEVNQILIFVSNRTSGYVYTENAASAESRPEVWQAVARTFNAF